MDIEKITSMYRGLDRNAIQKRDLYTCTKGHYTLANHKHEGVFPSVITCKCGSKAHSHSFKVPQKNVIFSKTMGKPIEFYDEIIFEIPELKDVIAINGLVEDGFIEKILNGHLVNKYEIDKILKSVLV